MQRGKRLVQDIRAVVGHRDKIKELIARRLAKRDSGLGIDDVQAIRVPNRELTGLITPINLIKLAEAQRILIKYIGVFDDAMRSEAAILSALAAPDAAFWEIPGRALFYLTDIRPKNMAFAHLIIYDKSALRSYGLLREMCRGVMDYWDLRRLNALVPGDNRLAVLLGRTLGFRREGCLRKWAMRDGQWTDMIMLGLLRREVES